MHASGGLRWYIAFLLWFSAVCGSYVTEGTTLRYHRSIGNVRAAVPSAGYYQANRSDKEVVRATDGGTTHRYDRMSTQLKDNTIGTTIPRSTTSSSQQDRSSGEEVVPGQDNTAPATVTVDYRRVPSVQEPTVLRNRTTSWYYKGKGERDVGETKSGANCTEEQAVIKGTTFGVVPTDSLAGTTEHSEREIVDDRDADAAVSGRKIKMPKPNSQTMQYLLVPGFLMAGILPWVMPKLQMVVMMLSMVNNMAFTSALFTLIRNFIFERETAQHVLYINNGYKKKNRHRNTEKPYKEHQGHAPVYYEHQDYQEHAPGLDHHQHSASQFHQEYQEHAPGLDHHEHSASQFHREYQEHPPGLDHHDHSASEVHHEYQDLEKHPSIRWNNQEASKFSEKWRRSDSVY
nr:unnamed protein product [Callosobruchus analis]